MRMKKLFLYTILLFILGSIIVSCQKDMTNSKKVDEKEFVRIDNGRLHFSSKEALSNKISELKQEGREFAEREMSKFYDKGFYSLRPIINKDNKSLLMKYEERKQTVGNLKTKIILDDLEDKIGDDEFASFVNDNGELVIGDTIYAYTDRGLFFSHISDSVYLHNYLENELSSTSQMKQSEQLAPAPCEYNVENGGIVSVTDEINRFIAPIDGCSGGGSSYIPPLPPDVLTFDEYIANLPVCDAVNGTFAWIFGPTKKCISNFDDSHRVKTKFWDQNYLVYKSIGVSVKHQTKKAFGIWWTTDTDEIGMGISQAYFEYDMPIPKLSDIRPQLYVVDGKIYDNYGKYLSTLSGDNIFNLPFTSSLEIVVNLPIYGIYENDISSKTLNKFFWETVWNQAKSVMQKLGKEMPTEVSLVGLNSQKIVVNYINTTNRKTNSGKVNKIFDFQVGFGIVLGDNNGAFTVSSIKLPSFYDYKNIKIDIYGAARQGDVWKGSHLIYQE